MKKYNIIYADPPWSYKVWSKKGQGRSAEQHYSTMTPEDIKSLPVREISADNSVLLLWVIYPYLKEGLEVMDSWGFCCVPETPILKKDLTWSTVGDIQIGDELLAFDENVNKNNRRYYKFSKVLKKGIITLPCYKVILSNGDTITCSEDHQWLCRYRQKCGQTGILRWIKTKDLLYNYNNFRENGSTEIIKLANVLSPEKDYSAGFISAAFDSEGSLNRIKPRICFSQKDNALLKTVKTYLDEKNIIYNTHFYKENDVCHLDVQGGMKNGVLDFLQKFRPPRLLKNWETYPLENISLYNLQGVTVQEIIPVGFKKVVMLETSTKTYIANGYASHNCYKTCAFSWIKMNKSKNTPFVGMGYYTRSNNEICLLGVKGKPLPRISHKVQQVVISKIREHSRKPDEVRDRIVELFGDLPRVELFCRHPAEGWDSIGNEVDGRDIRDVLK